MNLNGRLKKLETQLAPSNEPLTPERIAAIIQGCIAMHRAGTLDASGYRILQQIEDRQLQETGQVSPEVHEMLHTIYVRDRFSDRDELIVHDDSGAHVPTLPPGWGLLRTEAEGSIRVYGPLSERG